MKPSMTSSNFQDWFSEQCEAIASADGTVEQADKVARYQQTLVLDGSTMPLLHSKRSPWRLAIAEMLWFLSGSRSYSELEAAGVTWWRPWLQPDMLQLSPSMLPYMLHQPAYSRISTALQAGQLDSTRLYASIWPSEEQLSHAVLPPCAHGYQLLADEHSGVLHMTAHQRSADLLCGVPSNAVQYAFLLQMYSQLAGLRPGRLKFEFGNLHVYKSHMTGIEWPSLLCRNSQLSRSSMISDLPELYLHGLAELLASKSHSQLVATDSAVLQVLDEHGNGYVSMGPALRFEVVPVHTAQHSSNYA